MVEIRKAQDKDVPAVYKMGEAVGEFHTSNQAPNFWPEAVLRESVNKEDVYFFVAGRRLKIVRGLVIQSRVQDC